MAAHEEMKRDMCLTVLKLLFRHAKHKETSASLKYLYLYVPMYSSPSLIGTCISSLFTDDLISRHMALKGSRETKIRFDCIIGSSHGKKMARIETNAYCSLQENSRRSFEA